MEPQKKKSQAAFRLISKGSLLILLFSPLAIFADAPETPVGILLSAGDAKILRANSTTPVDAKPSDLVFSGDSIRTGSAPASYLFCAGKSRQTLAPKGEALFEADQVRIRKGKLAAQQPAGSCMLPAILRVSVASQQSYGAMRTRDLDSAEVPAVAHDKLPANVLADLAPFENAAAQSANDPSPLVGKAAVFERAGLLANAYEEYSKIQVKWTGVVWVKYKLAELDQLLAAKAAEQKRNH
jgi:hypothetical protein